MSIEITFHYYSLTFKILQKNNNAVKWSQKKFDFVCSNLKSKGYYALLICGKQSIKLETVPISKDSKILVIFSLLLTNLT